MHRPERWGYVQFSRGEPGTATFRPDPTLAARDRLMAVYYDQKAFQKQHGRWATTPGEIVVPDSVRMIVENGVWTATTRAATDAVLEVNPESRLITLP